MGIYKVQLIDICFRLLTIVHKYLSHSLKLTNLYTNLLMSSLEDMQVQDSVSETHNSFINGFLVYRWIYK